MKFLNILDQFNVSSFCDAAVVLIFIVFLSSLSNNCNVLIVLLYDLMYKAFCKFWKLDMVKKIGKKEYQIYLRQVVFLYRLRGLLAVEEIILFSAPLK